MSKHSKALINPYTSKNFQIVRLEKLTPYKNNARKHPPAQIDKIAKNMEVFGPMSPLLIDRKNRIIAGHARWEAAKKIGLDCLPVIRVEHLNEAQISEPAHIWATPLQNLTDAQINEFEQIPDNGAWPEVGSRMMTRVLTGQDLHNGWVVVQPGTYRYSVAQQGLMLVRSIIDEYLATEVYWID